MTSEDVGREGGCGLRQLMEYAKRDERMAHVLGPEPLEVESAPVRWIGAADLSARIVSGKHTTLVGHEPITPMAYLAKEFDNGYNFAR